MKDKILETKVSDACETIARALRAYSNKPVRLTVEIVTRETVPEKGADFYLFVLRDVTGRIIFDLGRRISYCIDKTNGQEAILGTCTCFGGVDDGREEM